MPEKELIALLTLQCVPGLGPVGCKNLIARCGSPSAVFADKEQLVAAGLRQDLYRKIGKIKYKRRAEREMEFLTREGIRCLSYLEPGYPQQLLHCADSPVLIFCKGNIRFGEGPLVSVVGTRDMTEYGRRTCEAFIGGISPANPIVISGYAYGVDICAQRTAMQYGLQTIAVMAHGLDQVYPAAHRKYEASLMDNGGYLTEFWSGTVPEPGNFLRRNRIIAGLSPATVVIESGERGGSLVTADLAFGYNREVFAVPGRRDDPQSLGCNHLIRLQKAQLLLEAPEFMAAMDWAPQAAGHKPEVIRPVPGHLKDKAHAIATLLQESGTSTLDEISECCDIPVPEAATVLFTLEMGGFIRPLPGKRFCWKP